MLHLYRTLLALYPRAFRARYADEMLRAFADRRNAARMAGRLSLVRFYIAAVSDLLANAAGERSGRPGPGPRWAAASPASRRWAPLPSLTSDARGALRMFCRRPALSFFSAITLALGIGAVTAVASLIDAVFLQPLPFPRPEQIVAIQGVVNQRSAGISIENLRDLEARSTTLTAVSPFFAQSVNLTGVPEPDRLRGAFVTSAFFDIVGIQPALGSTFSRDADITGGPRLAVLTHSAWQGRFGGRRDIVGRPLMLNNAAFTVVGVMPRDFSFPIDEAEVFLPVWTTTAGLARGNHNYLAIGRLTSGATTAHASSEAAAIAGHLEQMYPDINQGRSAVVVPLQNLLVADMADPLRLVFVMVAIMLTAACANVAGLQLGDTASRGQEIAIRAALGAGRARVARQLLMESVARSLAGAALGVAAAHTAVGYLVANAPAGIYGLENARLRPGLMLFGGLVAVLAGVAAGLPPALQWARAGALSSAGPGRGTDDIRTSRFRGALVVAQIALAAVLLVAAGLTIRSLDRLTAVDVGFDPTNVLTMEYRLPSNKYPTANAQAQFHRQVLERVGAVPGVVAAAGVRALPFSGNGSTVSFRLENAGDFHAAAFNAVSGSYFETMRIPRLAGRAFHPTGEKSPVVVVSRALAERLWPAVSPLGRPLYFDDGQIIARVVGVVGDVRHRELASGDDGTIYALQDQYPAVFNTLAVRAEGSPLALASAVRYALWTVDADQPVWKIRTVESLIDRSVAARRFLLQIVTFFGVSAAALAVVGLYAVVAAGVARRTREIGLRIALGATRTGVLRLVVLNGMRLGAAGVVLGLLAATLAGNLLRSYLFGVTAGDPLTYAAAALLLLVSSLTACWIPARRALHVDPVVALRQG